MEKLTLSIHEKEKIVWIKAFAKVHDTSVSRLFEKYVDKLMAFDNLDVKLSDRLQSIRQPGKRRNQKQIDKHLVKRRNRSIRK